MDQDLEMADSVHVKLAISPQERTAAEQAIADNKKLHIGGEFRQLLRFVSVLSALSLGMEDKEVERVVDEFDMAQAHMDRVNAPPPEISLDDLTAFEKNQLPDKYAPCPCGSGRKFKFCCWKSIKE
jgi:hypothetical protein